MSITPVGHTPAIPVIPINGLTPNDRSILNILKEKSPAGLNAENPPGIEEIAAMAQESAHVKTIGYYVRNGLPQEKVYDLIGKHVDIYA